MNTQEKIKQLEAEIANLKEYFEVNVDGYGIRFGKLDEPEFKVGDWVKRPDGAIDRIESFRNGDAVLHNDMIKTRGYSIHTLTKATPEEIEQALIKEAKRRGLTKANTKLQALDWNGTATWISDCTRFRYEADNDILFSHGRVLYKQGKWAEIIEDTITVNGHHVEHTPRSVDNPYIKIGCEQVPKGTIGNFSKYSKKYGLRIMRNGEDITEAIHKINERL